MNGAMAGMCEACSGTGRFQGRFSGPEWPECPACKGSGMTTPTKSLELRLFEHLADANNRAIQQAELLTFIKEEFGDVISYLAVATESYELYAGVAEIDSMYADKLATYRQALGKARDAHTMLETKLNTIAEGTI